MALAIAITSHWNQTIIMNQKIEEIIARFEQEGWLVQKTKESFWALRPKGVFNYKVFLLTYNPFDDKFTIVKPPTPKDTHYQQAVKILEAIATKPSCWKEAIDLQNKSVNSFNPGGNMASIFQISADTFLNLDDIRQLKANINRSEFKVTIWWRNG